VWRTQKHLLGLVHIVYHYRIKMLIQRAEINVAHRSIGHFSILLLRILVLTLWSSNATSWWKTRFEKTKVAEPSLLLCRVSSHRIILLSFRYVWEYSVRDCANEEKRKHSKRWERIRFLVARMCRQEVLPEILKMN